MEGGGGGGGLVFRFARASVAVDTNRASVYLCVCVCVCVWSSIDRTCDGASIGRSFAARYSSINASCACGVLIVRCSLCNACGLHFAKILRREQMARPTTAEPAPNKTSISFLLNW